MADHLDRVLARGRRSRGADDVPAGWLAGAIIALGHAAGEAVHAGRLSPADAAEALARSALRLCGVDSAAISDLVAGV